MFFTTSVLWQIVNLEAEENEHEKRISSKRVSGKNVILCCLQNLEGMKERYTKHAKKGEEYVEIQGRDQSVISCSDRRNALNRVLFSSGPTSQTTETNLKFCPGF